MEAENGTEIGANAEKTNSKLPCLMIMLVVSTAYGFCYGFLPGNSILIAFLTNVVPVVLLLCVVFWCYLDSYRYDAFLRRKFYLCLLLCPAVTFPYYIFRTRGLSGLATLGCALAFVVVCYLLILFGFEIGCALATVG